MSLRDDIRTYLLTQTPITNLVGQRVFSSNIPQREDYPAISIVRITGGHAHMLSGGAGFAEPTVQVDAWADTSTVCESIAEALRGELQGFRGTMGSTTVRAVVLQNEIDLSEEPSDGSDAWVYRITQDYYINYEISIPTF